MNDWQVQSNGADPLYAFDHSCWLTLLVNALNYILNYNVSHQTSARDALAGAVETSCQVVSHWLQGVL